MSEAGDALRQALVEIPEKPRPPVVVPFAHPMTGRSLVSFVEDARDWPQPMQDALIPMLAANGFRTQAEQDVSMKRALLRAAALDVYMTERERRDYANRYGRPNVIRLVWWVRRMIDRGRYDG